MLKTKDFIEMLLRHFFYHGFKFTPNIILKNNCCQKKSIDLKKQTFFNQHQTISTNSYLPTPIPILI